AEENLDELRRTFRRKAHLAALERCLESLLQHSSLTVDDIPSLTLSDLPPGRHKSALMRRRFDIGLSLCPAGRVFVDDDGRPIPHEAVPMRLRFAKSVRISMEGNAHFCRGLLATRYADDGESAAPRVADVRCSEIVRRVS
ncbi:MAG: metal-sulfur cluster biosynthetic enzyme, partial [Acidobacteria bacterium]